MSSELPTPDPVFIEKRVNNIAERALKTLQEGKPFSVHIILPQNVDAVYNGLVAKLSSHSVVLDTSTNNITISAPTTQ